jgi:membrane-bound lytic murein transglycosylase B
VTFAFASPPAADAPLPHAAPGVAKALTQTRADLRTAVAAWAPKSAPAPAEIVLDALYEQRLFRLLARNTKLADTVMPLLAPDLRVTTRDLLAAHRELFRLTPPLPAHAAIRIGPAAPASELLRFYREGQRRFGVQWNVLAAVNFVESKFGKLRNASASGAQGPMQFMPATWAHYGLGGSVHDAHDAILGAANYLHATGAPRNIRRALHAYNPSPAYVDAVLRYARRMSTMFYDFYNWQVFLKTAHGERRITGPGLP